jgi:hypothetical protein
MKSNRAEVNGVIIFVVAILVIAAAIVIGTYGKSGEGWKINEQWTTITVEDKHVDMKVTDGNSESFYMVVSTDGRIYEIDRPWWDYGGQIKPDRIYAQMHEGKTYKIHTYGQEFDSLGQYMYAIIVEAQEV